MKKYTNKLIKILPFIMISIVIGVTVAYAQTKLTPPETIGNTMYSLEDIYNLANGTPTDIGTGAFVPGTLPVAETGRTLTEVYNKVATALASLPPTLVWQTDPALNLCYSHGQYEIDSGNCSIGSGWIDASIAQDGSLPLGAVEYCQHLNTDGTTLAETPQNIWHLPTIKEYQSITDFTKYNSATNVTGFAEDTGYWSSTEGAEYPDIAWGWYSWYGDIYNSGKYNQLAVRCAH